MNTIKVMPHYVTIPFVGVSRKASSRVAVPANCFTVYTAGLAVCKGAGNDSSNYVLFLRQLLRTLFVLLPYIDHSPVV